MLSCALLVLSATLTAGEAQWEEVSSNKGVTVWARDVPGSSIREVRAEAVVAAEPKRCFEVLQDLEHYIEFMPYVEETKQVGTWASGIYEYQRIDPPVVDRRDYTLKVTLTADAATGVYKREWVEANDKGPPPVDGTVRVQVNRGSWTLLPLPGGKTQVKYYLFTDPGGSLPAWLSNKANKTSVPDLLAAVSSRAVNPQWKRD